MRQQKTMTRPAVAVDQSRAAPARPRDVRDTPAAAIMSSPAIAVQADVSLDIALTTFATHRVRHLAVVNEAGRCTGMITDRAVTARWAMRPMTFAQTRVSEVCGWPPPLAAPRATLAEVARVLRHCATDAVVVIDEAGRPLGMVTTSDLVAVIAKPRLS